MPPLKTLKRGGAGLTGHGRFCGAGRAHRYKVGDCFFSLPVEDVQQLLAQSTSRIEGEVDGLERKLAGLRDEMGELKVALYGRFGRSINLEL